MGAYRAFIKNISRRCHLHLALRFKRRGENTWESFCNFKAFLSLPPFFLCVLLSFCNKHLTQSHCSFILCTIEIHRSKLIVDYARCGKFFWKHIMIIITKECCSRCWSRKNMMENILSSIHETHEMVLCTFQTRKLFRSMWRNFSLIFFWWFSLGVGKSSSLWKYNI